MSRHAFNAQRCRPVIGRVSASISRLIVVAALLMPACAILDGTEDGILIALRSTGYVSLGFEDSTFLPCTTSEAWWLSWTPDVDLWEEYQKVATGPHELLFAVVRGDRSEKGRFGHLGGYDRVFTVTELVLIRKAEEGDCRWPGEEVGPAD